MQANSTPLPTIALSIRQPWAWLIAHGFKDFENRDWKNANPARKQVQLATVMGKPFDVLIHAAGTCTVREYDNSKLTVIEINQQREKAGLPRFGLAVQLASGEPGLLDIGYRMLNYHETAAAQSFPSDYKFTGTITQIHKQIGNAVPPALARQLFRAALSN